MPFKRLFWEHFMIRVAVTGGAGQINYNLLFRIASGELFGKDTPIGLHILEIPQVMQALDGVKMELEDCAFPMLHDIRIGDNPEEVFGDVDVAILVGSKPRGPGMERADLLNENGKIFVTQGKALNAVAKKDALVFVVGNPCNTNCLIAMHNAPDMNKEHFHAMTRLDQNRAQMQLAKKCATSVDTVKNAFIWGNHSSTQVPDTENVRLNGAPVKQAIGDDGWLYGEFTETVQKRGAAIIAARGKSSAASAANACMDGIMSIRSKGEFFSDAILSDGNPYGIAPGLIFSFPCEYKDGKAVSIVDGMVWDDVMKDRMKKTEQELVDERDMVKEFL